MGLMKTNEMKLKYDEAVKLYNMKRCDSALQCLQELDTADFSPDQKADVAYYMGLCYTKLERFEDALVYLEQVVSENRSQLRVFQCRLTLAYIYICTRRHKMAEFELDRLLNHGMKSVQIYTMMGFSAWTQKNIEKSIQLYEKALEIDPNNSTALNCLGYILADSGADIRRGLDLCKRAVDKRPASPAYLDSLGWAYFKTGEYNEARAWLRRALDLAPRHREIALHMKAVVGEAG